MPSRVVADVAELAAAWVDGAPDATFVVTTREVLGIAGEQVVHLPPLAAEAAVALFLARGASAKRGWTPSEAERSDVAELVELLDRMPLAIELAAARLRVLKAAQIAERLTDRFRLLAGGRRGDRHSTLRATLDWSWGLLEPWEQEGLVQLSVFQGGFTLGAAEAVLDLADWPDAPWGNGRGPGALVDKSLVVPPEDERFPDAGEHPGVRGREAGGCGAGGGARPCTWTGSRGSPTPRTKGSRTATTSSSPPTPRSRGRRQRPSAP